MCLEHHPFTDTDLQSEIGHWYPHLSDTVRREAVETLNTVQSLRDSGTIVYPPQSEVFSALKRTQPAAVKCVILGQDPYHGPGQANGLSFSVAKDCKLPPSLRNIFKELCSDLDCDFPPNGDLSSWADQGVLLLNSILTVEQGKPESHAKLGWRNLTREIVRILLTLDQPIVFLLWGKYAQDMVTAVYQTFPQPPQRKLQIASVHPSPLSASRGFFGSHPFSQVNTYLTQEGVSPIRWDTW